MSHFLLQRADLPINVAAGFVLLEEFVVPELWSNSRHRKYRKQRRMPKPNQYGTEWGDLTVSASRCCDCNTLRQLKKKAVGVHMPIKKKTKNKKASTRSRRSPSRKREVVVEETTRIVPARRHIVAVRQEPVTLSRALGEAAVIESAIRAAEHEHDCCKKKEASVAAKFSAYIREFIC